MSDANVANTIARERVDGLTRSNAEPKWLKESRLSAWEKYLQTPMPTARDEDWRKTEIDSLDLSQFIAVGPIKSATAASSKHPLLNSCTKAISERAGTFVEDFTAQVLSSEIGPALAAKGVIFLPLSEAVVKHPGHVEKYLSIKPSVDPSAGAVHHGQDDKFTYMNRALFSGGYFLYVPKNVIIEAPFLAFINLAGETVKEHGQAYMERLVVVAEDNSRLSLMTVFSSSTAKEGKKDAHAEGGNDTFANIFVEIYAGSGAKVDFVEMSQFGQNVFAVGRTSSFIGKDANLDYTTASLGGKQLKSLIETVLVEKGGNSDVKGIVLGHGSEHVAYNTIQEHASPDTTSNINFRVALKDSAASIYQGNIKVDHEAVRTNAFQSNKNLLLGTEAKADSIPKLEILTDDVKCSHGATVGPVDKEQLFYLMSRGLSRTEAEELIVIGFFAEVLNTINIKGAADWIGALTAEKIHQ